MSCTARTEVKNDSLNPLKTERSSNMRHANPTKRRHSILSNKLSLRSIDPMNSRSHMATANLSKIHKIFATHSNPTSRKSLSDLPVRPLAVTQREPNRTRVVYPTIHRDEPASNTHPGLHPQWKGLERIPCSTRKGYLQSISDKRARILEKPALVGMAKLDRVVQCDFPTESAHYFNKTQCLSSDSPNYGFLSNRQSELLRLTNIPAILQSRTHRTEAERATHHLKKVPVKNAAMDTSGFCDAKRTWTMRKDVTLDDRLPSSELDTIVRKYTRFTINASKRDS